MSAVGAWAQWEEAVVRGRKEGDLAHREPERQKGSTETVGMEPKAGFDCAGRGGVSESGDMKSSHPQHRSPSHSHLAQAHLLWLQVAGNTDERQLGAQ